MEQIYYQHNDLDQNGINEELLGLVDDLLELAEELITYPSQYFCKKWDYRARLDALRLRLKSFQAKQEVKMRL